MALTGAHAAAMVLGLAGLGLIGAGLAKAVGTGPLLLGLGLLVAALLVVGLQLLLRHGAATREAR